MTSLTCRFRLTMTALALFSVAAPTAAMAQGSVGGIPICVAPLTRLHYSPNTAGGCFPGHARLAAAANAALTEASASVAALRVDVNALIAGAPTGLAERVTALEAAVAALGTRIDDAAQALSASVAAITARQDATDQSIAQLRTELQAELLAARSSISSPNAQYTVTATDNGVLLSGNLSSLKLDAGGIGVKTGGNVVIEGGGNVDIKTGASASWKTGVSLTLDGAANVNIKGGALVDVKGGAVHLNGTCPAASLGSRVSVQTTTAGNPSLGTVTTGAATVLVPCS